MDNKRQMYLGKIKSHRIANLTENFISGFFILIYPFHLSCRCHLCSLFGPRVSTRHKAGRVSTIRLPLSLTWWERGTAVQKDVPELWRRHREDNISVGCRDFSRKCRIVKCRPCGTWVLLASAASFPSVWSLVLVLALSLLTCSLLDPVSPSAASSTPGLPRAHPGQRGPPHFVVAVGHLAGETQRHARVWGTHSGAQRSTG